jgi:hypothetical protein
VFSDLKGNGEHNAAVRFHVDVETLKGGCLGQTRDRNLQGREDLQTHHADRSTVIYEGLVRHGVVDGDHLDQRLAFKTCHRYQLSGVHSSWQYTWYRLRWQQFRNRPSLGNEPSVVDGVDMVD